MIFRVGDIVKERVKSWMSNHGEVAVVVIGNQGGSYVDSGRIKVARCDIHRGNAVNVSEEYSWEIPAYWELYTEEDELQRTIEEVIKLCS